jgi:SPX domain protein involved in polyphosphate accumulation
LNTAGYTELRNFRYERKYVSEIMDSFQVEQTIKLNPAGFSEIFQERYINNVYFDTPRFDFYYDNVEGRFDRVKYRIRWYGDLYGNVKNPILEMKIKRGMVGTKRSFQLIPFDFTTDFDLQKFRDILLKSDVPEDVILRMKNLAPSSINRYCRKYFRDFSEDFRITIDKDIQYYPAKDQLNFSKFRVKDSHKVVVELKYDNELNIKATEISNKLPFRLTKNSKYVTGIELFYDVLD